MSGVITIEKLWNNLSMAIVLYKIKWKFEQNCSIINAVYKKLELS